jgi:uncharacterized protein with FMN-binding domain
MRRVTLTVIGTAVVVVLLLTFKPHELAATAHQRGVARSGDAGNQSSTSPGDDGGPPADGGSSGDGSGDGSGGDAGSWTGAGATAGARTGEREVTGRAVTTRWGPVQVKLIISQQKIVGLRVMQAPTGEARDIPINERALPILNEETLAAQSAQIDSVSGASYTSEGYIRSLQSAIDKAGL